MAGFIFNEYVNVFKRNEDYIADGDTNIGVALIKSCPFNCTYKSLDSIKEYVATDYNITIPEIYGIKSLEGVELAYNEIGVDANVLVKALSTIFEGETWFSACGCVIFRNKDGSPVTSGEYPTGETELVSYYDFGEQVVTSGSPFKIVWKGASEIDPDSKGTVIVYTPELTEIYEAITNSGKVRVSEEDQNPDYLIGKLVEGDDISIEETEDHKVKISYIGEDYITSAVDSETIGLSVTSGELKANAKISDTSGNILTHDEHGLFVPDTVIPEDYITSAKGTATVDLNVTSGTLTSDVKISKSSGNILDVANDGLYVPETIVPEDYITSAVNTDSVALRVSDGTLTAELKLDENSGNVDLEITSAGLKADVEGLLPTATSADKGRILTPDENGNVSWVPLTGIHAPNATIEATEGSVLYLDSTRLISANAENSIYEKANMDIITSAGNHIATSAGWQIDRTAPYITDTVSVRYALVTGQGTGLQYDGGQLGVYGSTLSVNETVGINQATNGNFFQTAGNIFQQRGLTYSAEAYASDNQRTKYESDPDHAEIWSANPSNRGSVVIANAEILAKVNDSSGVNSSVDMKKNTITATVSGDAENFTEVEMTSASCGVSATKQNGSPCTFSVGNDQIRGSAESIRLLAQSTTETTPSVLIGSPTGTVMVSGPLSNMNQTADGTISVNGSNSEIMATSSVTIGVSNNTLKVTSGETEWIVGSPESSGIVRISPNNTAISTQTSAGAICRFGAHPTGTEELATFSGENYYVGTATSSYYTSNMNGAISSYPYNGIYTYATSSNDQNVTTTKYSQVVAHSGGLSLGTNANSVYISYAGENNNLSYIQMGPLSQSNINIYGRNGVKLQSLGTSLYLGWNDAILHGNNAYLESNNNRVIVTNSIVEVSANNSVNIHTDTGAPITIHSLPTSSSHGKLSINGFSVSAISYGDDSAYSSLFMYPNTLKLGVMPTSGDHTGLEMGPASVNISAYADDTDNSTISLAPSGITANANNGSFTVNSYTAKINSSFRLTSATTSAVADVEDEDYGDDDLNGILATSFNHGMVYRFGVKKGNIRSASEADDETIPTEKAVREAIDAGGGGGGTEWYLGTFTTETRPASPTEGQYGYDTTIDCVVWYIGGNWKNAAGALV